MLEKPLKKALHNAAQSTGMVIVAVLLSLLLLDIISGIYFISPNELGVIQRFGKILTTYTGPGLHYSLPWPIDKIHKVAVKKVHRIIFDDFSKNSYSAKSFRDITGLDSYCLTGDNNIVNLSCVLQYTIGQPKEYLITASHNEQILTKIVSNTIIHTLASMRVDEILTFGKKTIENNIKQNLQERINSLHIGLNITFVELREVSPPPSVQDYFDDVINAQMDKKKYVTTAESYRTEQILKAQAKATHVSGKAQAHKINVVTEASGETKRFLEQLKQARNDLSTAKQQLYQQSIKEIWSAAKKKYIVGPGEADSLRLGNP
ncbi:MAG: FtsH protease activity modulator HflK [bacterium]